MNAAPRCCTVQIDASAATMASKTDTLEERKTANEEAKVRVMCITIIMCFWYLY